MLSICYVLRQKLISNYDSGAVHVALSEDEIKKLEELYKAQRVLKLW